MNSSFVKKYRTELLLAAAVVLEILVLFYYNIFHLKDALDHDFAMVLRHVMEMGDRHTLFLKNWSYMSQGEMDEASLIALPLYMLTKNIWFSYCISGMVNILLWAWVIWRLTQLSGAGPAFRLLAMGLVFTAYDFGMLEYTNMLFFAGGYYVYKVLLPLLMMVIMLSDYRGKTRIPDIILAVIYHILLFFVGTASGTYSLLCGIFPVLIVFALCFILKAERKKHVRWGLITLSTFLVTFTGVFIGIWQDIPAYTYSIKSLEGVLTGLPLTFKDFLELLRVLTPYEERVSTLRGIIGLVHLLVAGFILLFGLPSIVNIFGLNTYRRLRDNNEDETGKTEAGTVSRAAVPAEGFSLMGSEEISQDTGIDRAEDIASKVQAEDRLTSHEIINSGLISIALWNFTALALTFSMPRYHIMGAIPLMLSAAINFGTILEKDKKTPAPDLFLSLAGAVLIFVCLYTGFRAETEYFHAEERKLETVNTVLSVMDENGIDTAFTIGLTDLCANLRVADTSREKVFETYIPENGFVDNHIFYLSERDRSAFSEKNLILAKDGELETCPDYIRNSYEQVTQTGDYTIWVSDSNPIDGFAGLPLSDRSTSTDLPSACEMNTRGTIDENGYLHTEKKGTVLESPLFAGDGTRSFIFTCNYEAAADMYFEIFNESGELIASYTLDKESSELSADFPGGAANYRYAIRKEGKEPAVIKEIIFTEN
ncbi:MAG TPA: hypothetical protein DCL38_05320 [Lachnospiraceae bacterium]|nr:hypothetical protein [Lachnospiraceae bacterium]